MSPEEEWVDIIDAARRHGCSAAVIAHRIRTGKLLAVKARAIGRGGRAVRKWMIKITALDESFSTADLDRHVAEIEAAAPPLSGAQKARLSIVLRSVPRDRAHGSPGG